MYIRTEPASAPSSATSIGCWIASLAGAILGDKEHPAVSLDPADGSLHGLLMSVGRLVNQGVAIDVPALFEGRGDRAAELEHIGQLMRDEPLRPSDWMINGRLPAPHAEAAGLPGKKPPLTLEDVERRALESQPAGAPRQLELPSIFNDLLGADQPASAGDAAKSGLISRQLFLKFNNMA